MDKKSDVQMYAKRITGLGFGDFAGYLLLLAGEENLPRDKELEQINYQIEILNARKKQLERNKARKTN